MKARSLTKSIGRLPWRSGCLFIAVALACFTLSPRIQAVLPPPTPDGGYPNFNTAEGDNALFNLTTGIENTALGYAALQANTTGGFNTAIGVMVLNANDTGGLNTAAGPFALSSNTSGSNNTAYGVQALTDNTTGGGNTATGTFALFNNTTASSNTATGNSALYHNTTGTGNTATGASALQSNTTASNNTANGFNALLTNTTGYNNTADGASALLSNTTGGKNTAAGVNALKNNTIGSNNTSGGYSALVGNTSGNFNMASGWAALDHNTTGSNNIALGTLAGHNLTTGSNNIDIGSQGAAAESNHIRIGAVGTQTATFIAGIRGATVAGGVGVMIDTNGHLGTVSSSEHFKEAIKPMDKVSEAILALKPVIFRYKHEFDPEGIPQFGLVAEQVEKVDPDLVARDTDGKPYTVRYEAVNAMLLNEFLKEHRTVRELKSVAANQQATIAEQQKQIQALTVGLQKVNARLELSKPVPGLADNHR